MKRESDYDNDALDQSEAFFRKKKIMMMILIFLLKNQNHQLLGA